MAAKDLFHNAVRTCLEKEGWQITHDPYIIRTNDLGLFNTQLKVDLGAQQLLAAEKEATKIAIEIKSLIGASLIYDFHNLVGQFTNYQIGIELQEPERILFVAIPEESYLKLKEQGLFKIILSRINMKVIVFNPITLEITLWIK